jgi:hypothetical protein
MAAAIEAIGGSSRIIAASGPKGNHVYAATYLRALPVTPTPMPALLSK